MGDPTRDNSPYNTGFRIMGILKPLHHIKVALLWRGPYTVTSENKPS